MRRGRKEKDELKSVGGVGFNQYSGAARVQFISMGIICAFVVIYAVMTVLWEGRLYSITDDVLQAPYNITDRVWSIRSESLDSLTELSLFLDVDYVSDTDPFVDMEDRRAAIALMTEALLADAPEVRDNVILLRMSLYDFYMSQETFLEIVSSGKKDNIAAYFSGDIVPKYQNVVGCLDRLYERSRDAVDAIEQKGRETLRLSVVASALMSTVLTIVAVASTMAAIRRNREAYTGDRLFQMVGNYSESFFLVFNVATNSVDIVSGNSERVLGITADDIKKRRGGRLLSAEVYNAFAKIYTEIRPTATFEREAEYIHPTTGETRVFLSQTTPMLDKKGGTTHYLTMIMDKTNDRQAEKALRDSLDAANDANASRRDFLSRTSHEIRTPMNAVIGMTAIARTASANGNAEKVADCLSKIDVSSRHLLDLINDILDMSKIEAGKMTMAAEPFMLAELVSSIAAIYAPIAEGKGVLLTVTADDAPDESVVGDQMRLRQIILNLLSNAMKFTPRGGKVTVTVAESHKYSATRARYRFSVEDTGAGIQKEFMDRLFKPFEQETASTARKYGGTGLGLSITYNLVSLMGGTISVVSEPSVGTRFDVDIDMDVNPQAVKRDVAIVGMSVLVVDDDEGVCEHVRMLADKLGMAAESATSGAVAVEMMKKKRYDICLLDWKMGGMDGIETTRAIRELEPDQPVVIVSAYDVGSIAEEAKTAGVSGFIAKPVFLSTLFDTLTVVMSRVRSSAKPIEIKSLQDYDFSGKRALLAEDNEINTEIAVSLLEDVNMGVETAANGKIAADMFGASGDSYYDVVLMDIQMPELDGYEATSAIRAMERGDAKTVPIIAMTANAFNEDVEEALRAGMNSHLAKPIDVALLYETLDRYLTKDGRG